jgi:hypothetical protein
VSDPARPSAPPLTEIMVVGRVYKVGKLTEKDVHETRADRKRMGEVSEAGGDVIDECYEEYARVTIVLLRQHAPDVTVALLDDMPLSATRALQAEFMRQLDELVQFHEQLMLKGPVAGNA